MEGRDPMTEKIINDELSALAKTFRVIASGSAMFRVSNGVVVAPSMLIKAAEAIEAFCLPALAQPKNEASKVINCLIHSRGETLFTDPGGTTLVNLDGYAIVPKEEWIAARAAIAAPPATAGVGDADLLTPLKNAAATIGAIYEWVERIEKAGGAATISGVASCHAMLTSLRKNADRTEKLIMEPTRAAIAKAKPDAEPRS
jgi:hypothetical protein